jgi:OOP family OmpA-OmpF porin
MVRHCLLSVLSLLILCLNGPTALAQADLRAQLFLEAEKALNQAREKQADIYAPKSFAQGMDAYNEADDYFKRGKPLDKIQDRLNEAVSYFTKSAEAAKLGEKTFTETMAARTDAQTADAQHLFPELWRDAEGLFRSAARELEDGNLSGARKEAGEAQGVFRKAELESIKGKFLNPTRALLKTADAVDAKDTSPKTVAKASTLMAQVENRLAQDRYNNTEARKLAEEAQYEAAHALYLNRLISQMKKQDRTFEDAILASEEPIRQIAAALQVQVGFDSGYAPAVQKVLRALQGPDTTRTRLTETVKRQENEIALLKARLAGFEGRAASASPEKKSDNQLKLEQMASQVSPLFAPEEAVVFVEGNNVVLRLYSLTFSIGRNTLESASNSLLTRVNQCIRNFPGCQVTVEGHTESTGAEIANQRISSERSEQVAQYLKANLPSSIAITSVGYGSTHPIGPKGKNKRIDVVIVPEWAIVGK